MGRWDDGTMGRWDDGTMGRWDDGTMGRRAWDGVWSIVPAAAVVEDGDAAPAMEGFLVADGF